MIGLFVCLFVGLFVCWCAALSVLFQPCSLSNLEFQNYSKILVRGEIVNCLWPTDGFSWRFQGRPWKYIKVSGLRSEIRTRDFPNTQQQRHQPLERRLIIPMAQ